MYYASITMLRLGMFPLFYYLLFTIAPCPSAILAQGFGAPTQPFGFDQVSYLSLQLVTLTEYIYCLLPI